MKSATRSSMGKATVALGLVVALVLFPAPPESLAWHDEIVDRTGREVYEVVSLN